jgi:hypothetical protein
VQSILFPGCDVHAQDFGSLIVVRWLKPANKELSHKTLAPMRAIPIHNNGDFL